MPNINFFPSSAATFTPILQDSTEIQMKGGKMNQGKVRQIVLGIVNVLNLAWQAPDNTNLKSANNIIVFSDYS